MRPMAPKHAQAKPTDRPDAATDADCRAVTEAALALGVGEFDFFRLAYRRWFGRQPDEHLLEKAFAAYMFGQAVPSWVRHLGRQVIDRRRQGTLDGESFGAGCYRDRVTRHPQGPVLVAGTIAIGLVLLAMILGIRDDPGTSPPPPLCTGTTGAYFYEAWANLLAGRPPPPCHPSNR